MSKSHRRENIKRIENNIKRRRPIRDVSERILIVVEGHSEEKYFNALRKRWRLHTVVVVENPDCTDPINLLAEASELLEESQRQSKNSMLKTPYDEVWIVYDLEKPNDERRRLSNDAKNRARKNSNIHFAISDPSFELWYVLHFEQTTKSFTTAKEIERYLKRHWSNYKKIQNRQTKF
ncbi:MAG: RloB family protein [Planctomycetaceae bacterium]|jgi:hypothetical protein|nr:RloB family protein [Planctomycetaceae bacterium]